MSRKIRWTTTEAEQELAQLATNWPGWTSWHIPNCPYSDMFCAHPNGAEQPVLHGGSPAELTHAIAEYTGNLREHAHDPTLDDLTREFPGYLFSYRFGLYWANSRDNPLIQARDEDTPGLRGILLRWAAQPQPAGKE